MNLLNGLFELVIRIWYADSQMRDQSLLGGDEFDRKSRVFVAKVCMGIILLLIIGAFECWWFTR